FGGEVDRGTRSDFILTPVVYDNRRMLTYGATIHFIVPELTELSTPAAPAIIARLQSTHSSSRILRSLRHVLRRCRLESPLRHHGRPERLRQPRRADRSDGRVGAG